MRTFWLTLIAYREVQVEIIFRPVTTDSECVNSRDEIFGIKNTVNIQAPVKISQFDQEKMKELSVQS